MINYLVTVYVFFFLLSPLLMTFLLDFICNYWVSLDTRHAFLMASTSPMYFLLYIHLYIVRWKQILKTWTWTWNTDNSTNLQVHKENGAFKCTTIIPWIAHGGMQAINSWQNVDDLSNYLRFNFVKFWSSPRDCGKDTSWLSCTCRIMINNSEWSVAIQCSTLYHQQGNSYGGRQWSVGATTQLNQPPLMRIWGPVQHNSNDKLAVFVAFKHFFMSIATLYEMHILPSDGQLQLNLSRD